MSTGGPGHAHVFAQSGWCQYCYCRDDGRLVGKSGEIYRAGPPRFNEDLTIDTIIAEMRKAHA